MNLAQLLQALLDWLNRRRTLSIQPVAATFAVDRPYQAPPGGTPNVGGFLGGNPSGQRPAPGPWFAGFGSALGAYGDPWTAAAAVDHAAIASPAAGQATRSDRTVSQDAGAARAGLQQHGVTAAELLQTILGGSMGTSIGGGGSPVTGDLIGPGSAGAGYVGAPLPAGFQPGAYDASARAFVGPAPIPGMSRPPAPIGPFQTALDTGQLDPNNPADVAYVAAAYQHGDLAAARQGIINAHIYQSGDWSQPLVAAQQAVVNPVGAYMQAHPGASLTEANLAVGAIH